MSNEELTELAILRIECNYLHHKINQIYHEIRVQNYNDPIQESFKKKCELIYKSYEVFCKNGQRKGRDVDLSGITFDDEDPE